MTIEFTKAAAIEAVITDALDAEMATRWVVVAETAGQPLWTDAEDE